MKRSRSVVLTSLMAGSGLVVSACDDGGAGATRPNTQLSDPPAASASASAGEAASEVRQYTSLDECKTAGVYAPAFCEQSFAAAQADHEKNAPKFNDQQSCEERYGVDQCVPRNQGGGGGSFFTPLLTGFIVGQALSNLGGGGFGGRALYRDRYGSLGYSDGRRYDRYGGGYGGYGNQGRIGRSGYDSPAAAPPSRVQSRSSVVSRGGFGGGGGRGFGG